MSNLKDALKAAGLVGTFGQVTKTGSAQEERYTSCASTCIRCTAVCISSISGASIRK